MHLKFQKYYHKSQNMRRYKVEKKFPQIMNVDGGFYFKKSFTSEKKTFQ